MENFRRAIGLRIKETKEVYEGEVTELTPVETENPLGGMFLSVFTRVELYCIVEELLDIIFISILHIFSALQDMAKLFHMLLLV